MDLENLDFCKSALKDCHHIYHLASRAYGVGYSNSHHLEMLLHNEKITNNLLEALKSSSNIERLLVTSSSCVYDDQGPDLIPELPVFLNYPEQVNRGYGWANSRSKAKLLCDEIGIQLIILRPFNIYGERYKWRGDYSQAMPMLIFKMLSNKNINVWGSGNQKEIICMLMIVQLYLKNCLIYITRNNL